MKETFEFIVSNPNGLHASIIDDLSNVASRYKADAYLQYHGKQVNLKSVMGVLSLGVPSKAKLTLICEGEDAFEAMTAIAKKIEVLKV